VIRAEYFNTDTYALKFYPKRCKRRDDRYSIIINVGDTLGVLYTVGSIIPELLERSPSASIAFLATRTFDNSTKTLEPVESNQRYRVYSELLQRYVGNETFTQVNYDSISCYMLINNMAGDVYSKTSQIEESFKRTYPNLLNFGGDNTPVDE
jgi:hypothetical protein